MFLSLTAKRVLWAIPVAFGVVTLTFFLTRMFTGDPVNLYAPPEAPESFRELIRQQMGLDKSLPAQYLIYLGNLLHFDLGTSLQTGQPVIKDLTDRLPATLEVGILGLSFGLLIGVPLGVWAAVRRERGADFAVRGATVGGMSLPQFWVGLVLIWIFAVELKILPGPIGRLPTGVAPPPKVTGFYLIDTLLAGQPDKWVMAARALVLPVATLTITTMAVMARLTRAAMVEALQSDYVRTAVAMGFAPRKVWFKYALRNALLPVITMTGAAIGYMMSGAVLLETVFGWPGVGKYALDAMTHSDFAALQGFVLYAALLYVAAYLIVDLAYLVADPRTRVR